MILCAPLTLVAGFLIWHATYVGFFAHYDVLEIYGLNAEGMGWRYQSRQRFFLWGLAEAFLLLAAAGLLARFLLRQPRD